MIYDAYVGYEYMKEMQEEKDKNRGKKDDTNHVSFRGGWGGGRVVIVR